MRHPRADPQILLALKPSYWTRAHLEPFLAFPWPPSDAGPYRNLGQFTVSTIAFLSRRSWPAPTMICNAPIASSVPIIRVELTPLDTIGV